MSAKLPADLQKASVLRATVSVDGWRWRQLPDEDALRSSASDSEVFIVDSVAGSVRFGDGEHGARPPKGALVSVNYRKGGGAAGDVIAFWEGRWPPRPGALADTLAPGCISQAGGSGKKRGGAKR